MKRSKKPKRPTRAQDTNNLVLVVENDEPTRELLTVWLSAKSIPCIGASSVSEAQALLQRHKVAVTLLDWKLDRSGAEVLAFCREKHPLMAVIVMSGQPFDVRTDALVQQADGFLEKPLGETMVVSHVERWLKRLQDAPKIILPNRGDEIQPLDKIKSLYIRHVAQLLNNNATLAAKRLGIHRQTVTSVLKTEDAAVQNN